MIKFSASNEWYKLAAESETDILDIYTGPPTLPASCTIENSTEEKKDIKKIRKIEGFTKLLKMLRLKKGFSVEKLALKINADIEEIILFENQAGYKPSPRTLIALANFHKIPKNIFLQLSGALTTIENKEIENEITKFAAQSKSFETLTSEEKKLLNEIIKILSNYKE